MGAVPVGGRRADYPNWGDRQGIADYGRINGVTLATAEMTRHAPD